MTTAVKVCLGLLILVGAMFGLHYVAIAILLAKGQPEVVDALKGTFSTFSSVLALVAGFAIGRLLRELD